MIDDDNTTIMEVFEQTTDVPLSLANPIRIPPHSIVVAVVECNRPLHPHMDIKGDAGFLRECPNIHVSRTYVNNPNTSSNCIPFSFTNLSMHSQYLGKDKVVGFAEPTTDAVEVHELADYDEIKEMMRGPRNHVSRKKQAKYKLPAVPIDNAFLTSPADIPGPRKWTCRMLTSSQRQGQLLMSCARNTQQYSPEATSILAEHSSLQWT